VKPEALQQLYDEAYAEQYNARFITHQNHGGKTAAEREVLGKAFDRIGPSARWLDLACGTGYFLAQFPNINRTGLDLSPGMLGYARKNNPDVPLVQGDFRNRDLFAPGSFDVISSMWWAYSYLETFSEIEQFVSNVSYWLADDGIFFLPIGDYTILAQTWSPVPQELPYHLNPNLQIGGGIRITGLTWSYDDVGGKRHENMLFPQPPEMVAMMRRHFPSAFEFMYTQYYRAVLASKSDLDPSFVADIVARYHTAVVADKRSKSSAPKGLRGVKRLVSRVLGLR